LIAPPSNVNDTLSGGVLEGIGEEIVNGLAQPLDILALQETRANTTTVQPIVDGLNTFYGVAGMYAMSPYQATSSSVTTSGNGPNALVYNTKTLQLLSSVPIDPPGGTSQLGAAKSGMSREVMRYQLCPAGVATNGSNIFYVYVSHYKSGANASDATARAGEAQIVRSNIMTALPPTARILHVGDFNTGDSSEAMYFTLTSPGTNQLIDPVNPSNILTTNWDNNNAVSLQTESSYFLQYRDDYHTMTTNVYYGALGGLKLITGTCHIFGNNGTTPRFGTVNNPGNTALDNKLITNGPAFISASQLLLDLTNAADHLPVVADYTIPMPAPRITSTALAAATNLFLTVTNTATNGIYVLLAHTNVTQPLANWTPLLTNVSPGKGFILTATNAVNASAPNRFYIFRQQ
jgi:hypothetical protein